MTLLLYHIFYYCCNYYFLKYCYSSFRRPIYCRFILGRVPPNLFLSDFCFAKHFWVLSRFVARSYPNCDETRSRIIRFGNRYGIILDGSVAEWLKAHDSKSCGRANVSEVRILSLPPRSLRNASKSEIRISRFTLDANPLASAKLEKVRLDYFLNEFSDFSGKIEGAENN